MTLERRSLGPRACSGYPLLLRFIAAWHRVHQTGEADTGRRILSVRRAALRR